MKLLRIATTIVVIAIAYIAETYASAEVTQVISVQNYLKLLEWHRAMITVMVSIPVIALVVIVAIWWNPLKQLCRGRHEHQD